MTVRVYCYNTKAWNNFIIHIMEIYKNDKYRNKTIEHAINDELGTCSGINITGTPYIEFITEEDAIIFKLKWS